VSQRIQTLKDGHCQGRRAFEEILNMVERMFDVDAKTRVKATTLANDLEAILKQAVIDLETDPLCYLRATSFDFLPESAVPRTPTTLPSNRSRSPSLREINTHPSRTQLSPEDAHSPSANVYRRRSESFGRTGVASATSNADGPELPLSQPDVMQDDALARPPNQGNAEQERGQQGFVRGWEQPSELFGPSLQHGQGSP